MTQPFTFEGERMGVWADEEHLYLGFEGAILPFALEEADAIMDDLLDLVTQWKQHKGPQLKVE